MFLCLFCFVLFLFSSFFFFFCIIFVRIIKGTTKKKLWEGLPPKGRKDRKDRDFCFSCNLEKKAARDSWRKRAKEEGYSTKIESKLRMPRERERRGRRKEKKRTLIHKKKKRKNDPDRPTAPRITKPRGSESPKGARAPQPRKESVCVFLFFFFLYRLQCFLLFPLPTYGAVFFLRTAGKVLLFVPGFVCCFPAFLLFYCFPVLSLQ